MRYPQIKVALACVAFSCCLGLIWGKAVVENEAVEKDDDEKRFGHDTKGFGSHDSNMVDWNSVGKRFGKFYTGLGSSDSNMIDWNSVGKRFGQFTKGFGSFKDANMVDWGSPGKRGDKRFGPDNHVFGSQDSNLMDWKALGKRSFKSFGNMGGFGSQDSNMIDWSALAKRFGNTYGGLGSVDSKMVDWSALAKRSMKKRQLESFNGLGGNSFNNLPFQDWRQSFGRSYRSFASPNRISTLGSGLNPNNMQNWGIYNRHARSAEDTDDTA